MAQPSDSYTTIRHKLRSLGLRLRLNDTVLLASRSLWLGTLLFALILLVGRFLPIPALHWWAVVPLLLWAVLVLGFLLFRPLPISRVARRVDQSLNLRERLATALELHDRSAATGAQPQHSADDESGESSTSDIAESELLEELVTLQQQDAASVARLVKPAQLPLRFDRQALLAGLVPLLLGGVLLWLPNPQDALLAQQQQVRETLDEVADDLDELREEIRENEALTPEEREALEERIAELQEQLRENMGNQEEALADLSEAEAELQQQLDPETDARRAALERMARNMEQLAGEQPSQNPDLEETARQLENMAETLENMTEEERQQLADDLAEQAAQMAAGDPQTAQNLSDASQALSEGETGQAAEDLQSAADSVRDAQQDIADQEAVEESLSEIQEGRERVASSGQEGQQGEGQQAQQGQQGEGQQGQQGEGQQGQQGEGQQGQQGEGQQGQQGEGQQGQQGEGQQGQQGQPGSGGGTDDPNAGQGNSSSDGNGDPDGEPGDGAGNREGDTVYRPYEPLDEPGEQDRIRGQVGEDGETESRQGESNLPGVNNPSVVPYEEVFPEYSESASEALDRGYIPPHLKDYVRDYFSQLEPGSN